MDSNNSVAICCGLSNPLLKQLATNQELRNEIKVKADACRCYAATLTSAGNKTDTYPEEATCSELRQLKLPPHGCFDHRRPKSATDNLDGVTKDS